MAPGGYTACALQYNPEAEASGITLSPDQGGHKVFLNSPLSTVLYCDITMFATEFGAEYVPVTHPEHATFSTERPFLSQTFNLIFCHGQVLRTHPRMEYREAYEATRLTFPQLTLAMQCISEGGTFIMLLHKVEAWDTMDLLYRFLQFSDIELFKPIKKHAIRSTFYLVAKQVRPSSEAARLAVQHWKEGWWQATFGGENGTGGTKKMADAEYIEGFIIESGVNWLGLDERC